MIETFSEQTVADQLGVPREQVAALRKSQLYVESDWVRKGREILLTRLGLNKLLEIISPKNALKLAEATKPAEEMKKPAQEAPVKPLTEYTGRLQAALESKLQEGFVIVPVTKVFPGKRIMFGSHEGRTIRIVVRDSKNFLVGMQIPVKHAHDEVYCFEGSLPRRKGRLVR